MGRINEEGGILVIIGRENSQQDCWPELIITPQSMRVSLPRFVNQNRLPAGLALARRSSKAMGVKQMRPVEFTKRYVFPASVWSRGIYQRIIDHRACFGHAP